MGWGRGCPREGGAGGRQPTPREGQSGVTVGTGFLSPGRRLLTSKSATESPARLALTSCIAGRLRGQAWRTRPVCPPQQLLELGRPPCPIGRRLRSKDVRSLAHDDIPSGTFSSPLCPECLCPLRFCWKNINLFIHLTAMYVISPSAKHCTRCWE